MPIVRSSRDPAPTPEEYANCHRDHDGGGITHTDSRGHDLSTGTLGDYYAAVKMCPVCYPPAD